MKWCAVPALIAAGLLLLSSGGSHQQALPVPTASQPDKLPVVEREGTGVAVRGVGDYLIAADGSGLAFQTPDGIWAMAVNGDNLRQLAAGDAERTLVRLTRDEVVYLERQPGQLLVARGQAAAPAPEQIATLPGANLGNRDIPVRVWHHVNGDRLTVAIDGEPFRQVDLTTGQVTTLGEEPVAVMHGALSVSPDGRYLAFKESNRGDAVRILDLQSGSLRPTEGEAHVVQLSWSPVANDWAVLAAEPGSGLPEGAGANSVRGGTHIDIGGPDGTIRHLHPPEGLKLMFGPWWSPDGKHLAVEAELHPPGNGQPYTTALWMVDAESGAWKQLQMPGAGRVTGWERNGRYIQVSALLTWMRVPIDGGKPESAEPVGESVTLADGSTVYTLTDRPDTHVFIRHPFDQSGVLVLDGPGYKHRLAAKGMYATLVVNGPGNASRLVILNLK